jgi:hypothetical protein
MEKVLDSALVWFRRDLRFDDNAALFHALKTARKVWCGFVLDREILDSLPRADRRVEFIRDSLAALDALALSQSFYDVHQHDISELAAGNPVRTGRTDIASTYDGYFLSCHIILYLKPDTPITQLAQYKNRMKNVMRLNEAKVSIFRDP